MSDQHTSETKAVYVAESDGGPAYLVQHHDHHDARGIVAMMHECKLEEITLRPPHSEELAAWDLWCSKFGPGSEATPAAISVEDAVKALRARS